MLLPHIVIAAIGAAVAATIVVLHTKTRARWDDGTRTWFDRLAAVVFAAGIGFGAFSCQQLFLLDQERSRLTDALTADLDDMLVHLEIFDARSDLPQVFHAPGFGYTSTLLQAHASGLFPELAVGLSGIEEDRRQLIKIRDRLVEDWVDSNGKLGSAHMPRTEIMRAVGIKLRGRVCRVLGRLHNTPPEDLRPTCADNSSR